MGRNKKLDTDLTVLEGKFKLYKEVNNKFIDYVENLYFYVGLILMGGFVIFMNMLEFKELGILIVVAIVVGFVLIMATCEFFSFLNWRKKIKDYKF